MSGRIVLQHSCVRPDWDDGTPLDCKCRHRIRRSQAEALVLSGHAKWRRVLGANGALVESRREVLVNAALRFPRAHVIGAADVIAATVEGKHWAREFVDGYGGIH